MLINTWQHTLPIAEALALECLPADAVLLIHLVTDNLYRAALHEIAEHTLRKTPRRLLAAYGAVIVGLGENRDLGGENATGFGWSSALLGAMLEVDGQKLIADGKLMI